MPGPRRRYRFVISESFTPDTLPMSRLAEYMSDVADLLGEKTSVHFVRVEAGSAVLVQEVEHEAYPKIRQRIGDIKRGEGQPDARRAYDSINRRLAADNAAGELVEEPASDEGRLSPARVLDFPGRNKLVEPEYGPLTQSGSLRGVVIVVGGGSDPVPVHLEDGETVHICRAKRAIAKELASHIFGNPVRVTGNGRWLRESTGQWVLRNFQVTAFTVLRDDSLSTVVAKLRQVPGRWKAGKDALATLETLRGGED